MSAPAVVGPWLPLKGPEPAGLPPIGPLSAAQRAALVDWMLAIYAREIDGVTGPASVQHRTPTAAALHQRGRYRDESGR